MASPFHAASSTRASVRTLITPAADRTATLPVTWATATSLPYALRTSAPLFVPHFRPPPHPPHFGLTSFSPPPGLILSAFRARIMLSKARALGARWFTANGSPFPMLCSFLFATCEPKSMPNPTEFVRGPMSRCLHKFPMEFNNISSLCNVPCGDGALSCTCPFGPVPFFCTGRGEGGCLAGTYTQPGFGLR